MSTRNPLPRKERRPPNVSPEAAAKALKGPASSFSPYD